MLGNPALNVVGVPDIEASGGFGFENVDKERHGGKTGVMLTHDACLVMAPQAGLLLSDTVVNPGNVGTLPAEKVIQWPYGFSIF